MAPIKKKWALSFIPEETELCADYLKNSVTMLCISIASFMPVSLKKIFRVQVSVTLRPKKSVCCACKWAVKKNRITNVLTKTTRKGKRNFSGKNKFHSSIFILVGADWL